MRSRSTNFLQVVVLLNALIFIIIGLVFFISPLPVLQFFAENVSENWLDLVMDNELIAPLYFISRGFAALLVSSGAAMILPLFDPLRYRGLVYFDGLIFPLLAAVLFLKNGIFFTFVSKSPVDGLNSKSVLPANKEGHLILIVLGIIFLVLFILNFISLMVTRKEASEGIE